MRILIADPFPKPQLEKLSRHGYEIRHEPALDSDDLPDSVGDAEVLVVRSTKVGTEIIDQATSLGLIVRAGAGTNTIDTEAASAKGIYVSNVPGRNSVAVAELTIGLMLALDRHIPDNVAEIRDGRWRKSAFSSARGLKGRTLGIVGLGAVGIEVAARAKAFGMRVVGLTKPDRAEETADNLSAMGIELVPTLEDLLPNCDFVSLHIPAADDTTGLVDRGFLTLMTDGSCLINTSRADVVDPEALLEALDSRDIRAALDVHQNEPETGTSDYRSELARHPRVYATHHIGASTEQAQESIAKQVVKVIDRYRDGRIRNVVNLAEPWESSTVVSIRHIDRVGVLSEVFAVLSDADLNVEQMENHVFSGGKTANAVLHVAGDCSDDVIVRLRGIEAVHSVSVRWPET